MGPKTIESQDSMKYRKKGRLWVKCEDGDVWEYQGNIEIFIVADNIQGCSNCGEGSRERADDMKM